MKKIGSNRYVYEFSVDYNIISTSNYINIHKYLMKKHDIKYCLELLRQIFIVLFIIVNASKHTKYLSLSNQKFEIQPTLINLHLNECSQKLYYYPFAVKSNKCVGSFNTLNDLSIRVCVPNKTEDLNIHVFYVITEKNESKILRKDISCKCKCKFDGRKGHSDQKCNNDKCRC